MNVTVFAFLILGAGLVTVAASVVALVRGGNDDDGHALRLER